MSLVWWENFEGEDAEMGIIKGAIGELVWSIRSSSTTLNVLEPGSSYREGLEKAINKLWMYGQHARLHGS